MWQYFDIAGTGLHFPRVRLDAEAVDRRAGLPAGWTRRHAGVAVRYECQPPETLATMARSAADESLRNADTGWTEIDLILDCSTCRHQPIPCNAALLQAAFGPEARGIPCMDIQSTCLGFIVAMQVVNGLFAAGPYRQILVVCSEALLKGVNWQEPQSACVMGDAAAAVVFRRRDPIPAYHFAHRTYSEHADVCRVLGGGHAIPPFDYHSDRDADFRFHMDGRSVFRTARRHLPEMVESLILQSGVPRDRLHFIPHQASPGAVEKFRRLLGVPRERFHAAREGGNLAAASIPAMLHRCLEEGVLGSGASVMLLGTSAGYSQAALVFRMQP